MVWVSFHIVKNARNISLFLINQCKFCFNAHPWLAGTLVSVTHSSPDLTVSSPTPELYYCLGSYKKNRVGGLLCADNVSSQVPLNFTSSLPVGLLKSHSAQLLPGHTWDTGAIVKFSVVSLACTHHVGTPLSGFLLSLWMQPESCMNTSCFQNS